jgi:hypothetical protein
MSSPDQVSQGATYTFSTTGDRDLHNDGFGTQEFGQSGFGGYDYTLDVKQYPGDASAISRALNGAAGVVTVTLTALETAALAVGLWFVILTWTRAGETIKQARRVQVTKLWI